MDKKILLGLMLLAPSALVLADGVGIDKVYHPYVTPLERELEFRLLTYPLSDGNSNQLYRLGYGQTFSERWFGELYLIGQQMPDNNLELFAYEGEVLLQLTEQGEYAADYGLLFEMERRAEDAIWETRAALLVEHAWGKAVVTANLSLINEFGDDIENELETAGAFQMRYRYSLAWEPALELYLTQVSQGVGPVMMGDVKTGIAKRLHWELGVIAGMNDKTADSTLRGLVEYEF